LYSLKKLQEHYDIVHIHGNNNGSVGFDGFPEFVEITFIRKDFYSTVTAKRRILPLVSVPKLVESCESVVIQGR
jgi:hypothetical protein